MLKNRLLPIGVLLFACGIAISVCSDGMILPLCFAALTVSCSLLCAIRFLRLRTALIFGLLPLAAFLYVNLYSSLFIPHSSASGSAYAVITEDTGSFGSRKLTASVKSSDVIGSGKNVVFYYPYNENISFGDTVYLEGRFTCLDKSPTRLASRVYYSFSGDAHYIDESSGFFINLRRKIMENCDKYLGDASSVVKAITIADRSGITSSDYKRNSRAGTSHILAVSGLHLTIAVMAIYSFFKKKLGNRYVVCALGAAVVFLFLAVSDFPLSSVRAGIMLCLMFVSDLVGEKRDSFTSLFAAFGIILLCDPYAVASVSLQLSFLATLGIISVSHSVSAFAKPETGFGKFLYEYAASPIRFTLSSLVFTLPVSLTSFGTVSVISPVSSVIVSVIFPFWLSFSYIFCFLSLVFPFASKLLACPVVFFSDIFESVLDFLASFRYSSVTTDGWSGKLLLIVSIFCIFAMLIIKKKRFAILFYVSVVVMTLAVSLHIFVSSFEGSKAYFYDSSDGYAVVAVSGNECVFVDDGTGDAFDSLVTRAGKTTCGKAVFRDLDSRSVAKAKYFMECMGTEELYFFPPADEEERSCLDAILYLANENGCDIIYKTVHVLNIGDITLTLTTSGTGICRNDFSVCVADGDVTGGPVFEEKTVLPSCNAALSELYENACTYPKGSFTDLLEQEN